MWVPKVKLRDSTLVVRVFYIQGWRFFVTFLGLLLFWSVAFVSAISIKLSEIFNVSKHEDLAFRIFRLHFNLSSSLKRNFPMETLAFSAVNNDFDVFKKISHILEI